MSSPTAAEFFYPPKPTFTNTFSSEPEPETSNSPTESFSSSTTITLTPSNGSTCLSLYPRTKSFSLHSTLSPSCFLATCDLEIWRITQDDNESSSPTEPRFTFERLGSVESTDAAPLEVFKRCKVDKVEGSGRRGTGTGSFGRRISIGDYSSGYGGGMPMRAMSLSGWRPGSPTRF